MPKTQEFEIICIGSKTQSNYDAKIRVSVELDSSGLSDLINSIPKEEYFKYLSDEVFEEWAEENGYVREAEVK